MKRAFVFFLISSFAFVFSACASVEFNIEETIKSPVNENVSLYGTWEIEEYISAEAEASNTQKGNAKGKSEKFVGGKAIFDAELSAIGPEVCTAPKYRVMQTSSDVFFQNKYRLSETTLGLNKDEIGVFSITSDNKPFYELIVTGPQTAYVYMDNGFLRLNKISDTVDKVIKQSSYKNVGKTIDNGEYTEDPLLRSGVLMGIRSSENTYRTLWIYSKNREIKTVSSRRQLLIPRARGFWELGLTDIDDEMGRIYSEPFADSMGKSALVNTVSGSNTLGKSVPSKSASGDNDLLNNTLVNRAPLLIGGREELVVRKEDTRILFVGNDYFGIEIDSKAEILPVDHLMISKGMELSYFVDDAEKLLKQSRDTYVNGLTDSKKNNITEDGDDTNFMLSRRNGRWVMKSRLYFNDAIGNRRFDEIDLNVSVPRKLINYDNMDISWNEIKSKFPWIIDAYMSPNKDIAILVSNEGLNIHPIQNKNLVGKQLAKIPLSKGDSIIMTEWAVGKYADIWGTVAEGIFTNIKP